MPATYEPIATTTLASAVTTFAFSSIPATYTDLKVILIINGSSGGVFSGGVKFNGSSGGTEYSESNLYTDGASSISVRNTSDATIAISTGGSVSSTIPAIIELDIFSYTSSSIFKTCVITYSNDRNGTGFTGNIVGIRRNTAAITQINFDTLSAASFAIGTTATLYGIKAA